MEELKEQLAKIEQYSLLAAKRALSIDDACLLSGISKSHLYKLTCKHLIPHYKPNGKMVYFDKTELENWLLQNRVTPVAEAEQDALNLLLRKEVVL